MTADRKPMVRIATLWERESKAGNTYYSGYLGNAQLLMFRGEEITRDNGDVVQTWNLLVQEKEEWEQRPPPRPTRGQSTWDNARDHDLPTGETKVHRNERRRDPRQERIDELAARFDERGADEITF